MTRRSWFALVVVVLIGISATTFVQARSCRPNDDMSLAYDDDVSPCEVMALVEPLASPVVIRVAETPISPLASEHEIIAIAPKTSPPR